LYDEKTGGKEKFLPCRFFLIYHETTINHPVHSFIFPAMKRIISLAAILLLILTACQFKPYSVTGNRITVRIKSPAKGQAKTMMVQIVNDRIIRVSATDGNKIPDVKSLMAVERPEESQDFTCKQEDDRLLVSTPALRMHISLKTVR
jgi:hypothetical protein